MDNGPMKKAIVCDIDGVILNCPNWRDFEDFYENLDKCVPVPWAIDLLNLLSKEYKAKVIFMTARNEKCRSATLAQLRSMFDFPIELYMRRKDDLREDWEVKQEYTQELIKKYNIIFALDDNPYNCRMFRLTGINTLHIM